MSREVILAMYKNFTFIVLQNGKTEQGKFCMLNKVLVKYTTQMIATIFEGLSRFFKYVSWVYFDLHPDLENLIYIRVSLSHAKSSKFRALVGMMGDTSVYTVPSEGLFF